MENVTFIFNKCLEICKTHIVLKQRLQDISDLLEKEVGIILSFEERIGKRWKYISGSKNFFTPFFKYDNNTGYGILVQDWGYIEDKQTEVIDFLFENCIN